MKKQALIVALLAASGFASTSVFAADGTIDVTGAIQGMTCTISGGPGTTPGAGSDFGVELLTVHTSSLAAAGEVAAAKLFNIQLGTDGTAPCPVGTRAQVLYEVTSPLINPLTGNLRNAAATDPATNVEIQILDGSNGNTPMNLASGDLSAEVTTAGPATLLPFAAQYIATGGAATVGNVETSVQYSVKFN